MKDTKEILRLHRHINTGMKMKKTHQFSAIIQKEDGWYVSTCPELDVASQGKTVEEAISNLKEAVELFLEDKKADYIESIEHPSVPVVTTFSVVV
jgi:predicted RNase H-like HicB family nuclease